MDRGDERCRDGITRVERSIGPTDRVEQQRRRPGSIEVVVHPLAELRQHVGVGVSSSQTGGARRERVEPGEGIDRGVDVVLPDRDRAAVVRLQQQHPVRAGVVVIHQVEQVGDVAEALRHLLALGIDHETVVHPMVGKSLAQSNRLSALVLVMRELEVHATAVQVEALAEDVEAHHHAFAVPAGSAVTPRRRPRWLARLGQLPHREVGRMPLVLGTEHLAVAATFEHVGEVLVDQ